MGRETGSGNGGAMTAIDSAEAHASQMRMDGEILRLARNHLELTQPELAGRLGVSPRTIVNWEASGVPAHRLPRVERRLGPAIRVAIEQDRSARTTPAGAASAAASPSPETRRERLRDFTDSDLLNELQMRALRREAAREA